MRNDRISWVDINLAKREYSSIAETDARVVEKTPGDIDVFSSYNAEWLNKCQKLEMNERKTDSQTL